MKSERPTLFRRMFRRDQLSEDTLRSAREVRELIDGGYDPREDPDSPYCRSDNPKRSLSGYGTDTKYSLVETATYINDRERMTDCGIDPADLDYIIMILLRGDRLPSGAHPRKLRGGMKGLTECHIGGRNSDWVLVYQYDRRKLVLYAVNTGNHRECHVE